MPEQRLQKTRKAYDGYRYWPMRPAEQRDTPEGATLFVRGRTYVIGETVTVPKWRHSAAYRITQAQLAADAKKAHDERV